MSAANDRTVHGRTVKGWRIVRYDRAGKWYLEPPKPGPGARRREVSVTEAAEWATSPGGKHYPGRAGGTRFDALVNRYLNLGEEP